MCIIMHVHVPLCMHTYMYHFSLVPRHSFLAFDVAYRRTCNIEMLRMGIGTRLHTLTHTLTHAHAHTHTHTHTHTFSPTPPGCV